MWYFKGRRKKYKSPYTGKEVDASVKKAKDTTSTAEEIDAAVAKAGTIPDVTVADARKFLRVNSDGKLNTAEYPIEKEVNVVYSGDVTTTESPETVSVVEFSGTIEDFSQLNVVVDDETLVYDSIYNSFADANDTVSILLADGYIKLFAYYANTFAVEIKQINELMDDEFERASLIVIDRERPVLYNHIITFNNGAVISIVMSSPTALTTQSLAMLLFYLGIRQGNPLSLPYSTELLQPVSGSGVVNQYHYNNMVSNGVALTHYRVRKDIEIVDNKLVVTTQSSEAFNATVLSDIVSPTVVQ